MSEAHPLARQVSTVVVEPAPTVLLGNTLVVSPVRLRAQVALLGDTAPVAVRQQTITTAVRADMEVVEE